MRNGVMSERGDDAATCRLDARVHRCEGCGTWCLGARPCTTCALSDDERKAG